MSDLPPVQPSSGGAGDGGSRVRPASVSLRGQTTRRDESGAMMDPANQSLAEALNITFRVIQAAMVGLFALFCLSGFQTVNEGESGIRLIFGRVEGDNLPPGFQFSLPFPVGELVKVRIGAQSMELDEAFWPRLTAEQRNMSVQQLANQGKLSLKPGEDGSLLTGDTNVAHTRWRVIYRRERPADFVQNLLDTDEPMIVRAAVQRGVVHAIAGITIDQLLKESPGESGSVANRAREVAQRTLDSMRSGIVIDQLSLLEKTPPFMVINDFNGVEAARSKASQRREEAEGKARSTLNAMAGAAHPALLERIDAFALATDAKDTAGQDAALASIFAIFEGRDLSAEQGTPAGSVSGLVATMINEARQYRSNIVNQRRAELSVFQSKLKQYRNNPTVVLQREWSDAMQTLLARDMVETFRMPSGAGVLELVLNRDPSILRELEKARKLAENLKSEEERKQRQIRERLQTRVDGVILDSR